MGIRTNISNYRKYPLKDSMISVYYSNPEMKNTYGIQKNYEFKFLDNLIMYKEVYSMSKKMIMIFLMLALIFSLAGCGSRLANTKKVEVTSDSTGSKLKNAKPVVVAPEVIKKNVQAATKASDKLTSIGSKLDSVDDFDVKDNSGLGN